MLQHCQIKFLEWIGLEWGWLVAGLTKNRANSAFQLKLELGLRMRLEKVEENSPSLYMLEILTAVKKYLTTSQGALAQPRDYVNGD